MPLIIYGVPVSQPVRAVIWACKLKNLTFDLRLTMPGSPRVGGTRHPDFLKLNPGGTVPCIDDDGVIVSEASAILCYLAEKHRWTDLLPTSLPQKAAVLQYLSWHPENTRKLTLLAFAPVVRGFSLGDAARTAPKTIDGVLTMLDNRLGTSAFLCQESPTIADLMCYAEVGQFQPQFFPLIDLQPYRNVQNWLKRMQQLKGHDEAHEGCVAFIPAFQKMKAAFDAKQSKL
eukprot:TRINITY_DN5353_c0_g1_i1.p1 TRINITY_DN5353_c0_g1~~TRINITY_DN5353_c0_g1_i1.p1  ORF type:complete len:230 (-),score=30.47 TRINITY_DN5353_c0_g1_i1:33-722(-)